MNAAEQKIIEIALGENGLPAMARAGEDPGKEYFIALINDLKKLCELLKDTWQINKDLAYALHCLGHLPYIEYSNAVEHGKEFRDDLFDPQLLELEMAVESVFCGEWMPFLEEE